MCLYPKLIFNKKYTKNQKNGGIVPAVLDKRVLAVPTACGNCEECKRAKAREWTIRLNEELRHNINVVWVGLTFSEEKLNELIEKTGKNESNAIATYAVRHFLERWRKDKKKSVKHWLITELGHEGTERIHLHGFLWTNETKEYITKKWEYGWIYFGKYVSSRSINYMMKYVTKIDEKHKNYKQIILCSSGIGKQYKNTWDFKQNKYKNDETKEYYRLPSGHKVNLPIYYRNKLYNDEEREKLWLNKLDQNRRYINGKRYELKTKKDEINYINALIYAQQQNVRKGYGTRAAEWKKEDYNAELNKLNATKPPAGREAK